MVKCEIVICGVVEIVKLCEVVKFVLQVLMMIIEYVKLGVIIDELDVCCCEYIIDELGVIFVNIGYYGYLKMLCMLVNYVVCYGILMLWLMCDGDIVNFDIVVIKDGWFGDMSCMYFVGELNEFVWWFVVVIYEVMYVGICVVCFGVMFGDVGYVIQQVVYCEGFSVVCEYCGYGIGDVYYDELQVLYYGCLGIGLLLWLGMIFMIELMFNVGKCDIYVLVDGWMVVMKDYLLFV